MNHTLRAPSLQEIRRMRPLIQPWVNCTPLHRFEDRDSGRLLHLKLENLQENGAFKVRPAAALLQSTPGAELERGVYTASSGNFGIALAALAGRMGVAASVVVPETAPAAKLERLHRHGARVLRVSETQWWDAVLTHHVEGATGIYLDAVADTRAQAGSGTIGLEILEQYKDAETVFIPFGGGGLACGVAAAIKAQKPGIRVVACESEQAAPLAAAFAAGSPVTVACSRGFVSGLGASSVLPRMWPLLRELVDEVVVVSLRETAAAIRALALHGHVVAEGAGAVSVAAARRGEAREGGIVCIVSGGNIGAADLSLILEGTLPVAT